MESVVNDSANIFLGSSQTFLGVLATIIVLCIFRNGNNFIKKVLDEIKKKITVTISHFDEIENISSIYDIASNIKGNNGHNYKLITYYVSNYNIESQDSKNNEIYNQAKNIISSIEIERIKLQCKNIILQPKLFEKLNLISKSKEIYTSPLYGFMFCILLFIYDELFTDTKLSRDFLVTSLTIINVYSYTIMGLMWFNSIIRSLLKRKTSKQRSKVVKYKYASIYVSIALFSLLAFILPYCEFNETLTKIIFYLFLIAPCTIAGIMRFRANRGEIKYYDIFVASHFVRITIFAIIISCLFYCMNGHLQKIMFVYSDYYILKASSLIFVLLFGIIMPFFFPWFMYYMCNMFLNIVKYKRFFEARKISKRLIKEMNSIAEKIPYPESSE